MSYSRGKWTKYKILSKSAKLAKTLPPTSKLSLQTFSHFLQKYNHVIIKPTFGSGGHGVLQVSSKGKGIYEVRHGKNTTRLDGKTKAYAFVKGKTKGSPHIIQQKISLAKVNSRPFDLRVMVQKMRKKKWKVTAKLAKIAGPGYIVTNVARSKGKALPFSKAIKKSTIRKPSVKKIEKQIDTIALKAVKVLRAHYHFIDTVGLDIALDDRGKIWIIEPNFTPIKQLFNLLEDKSLYRRIMHYYKRRH
ncbi:YheC/YheD family protein [Brevibacillus sp. SYSU BS000544]|uniref:YheC/YheD family protein n=1 Tax=Brevibacillus sp. SYSU BS000544 TaxID=3416443 RepID=UPI003CE5C2EE